MKIRTLCIAFSLLILLLPGMYSVDLEYSLYGRLGYTVLGPDGAALGYTNISTGDTPLNDQNSSWSFFNLGAGGQVSTVINGRKFGLDASLMTVFNLEVSLITSSDEPGDKDDFTESSLFLSFCPYYELPLAGSLALQFGPGLYLEMYSYRYEFVSVMFPELNETKTTFEIYPLLGCFAALKGGISSMLYWSVRVDMVLEYDITIAAAATVGITF